jgi:Zn finger protein HypA/HybF involved in hydrogenase expression
MSKIKIPTLKCLRCGHTWMPRTTDVRLCPHCKNVRWNEPPEKKPTKEVSPE